MCSVLYCVAGHAAGSCHVVAARVRASTRLSGAGRQLTATEPLTAIEPLTVSVTALGVARPRLRNGLWAARPKRVMTRAYCVPDQPACVRARACKVYVALAVRSSVGRVGCGVCDADGCDPTRL